MHPAIGYGRVLPTGGYLGTSGSMLEFTDKRFTPVGDANHITMTVFQLRSLQGNPLLDKIPVLNIIVSARNNPMRGPYHSFPAIMITNQVSNCAHMIFFFFFAEGSRYNFLYDCLSFISTYLDPHLHFLVPVPSVPALQEQR